MGKAKSAEKLISKHCSDFDATASPPDEDKFGWDMYVQFPHEPFFGAAEDRPERQSAYVQVKSTQANYASAKIKLSNIQEAVTSSAPWFFFMVMGDDTIRAKHLWGDLLENWLRLVRRADVDGKSLHHEKTTLTFPKSSEIIGNAAKWMKDEIEKVGNDYFEAKRSLIRTIGFENGHGIGNITFDNMTAEHIAAAFLGMRGKVPVAAFSFTKSRFGIPDAYPTVDKVTGELKINARPVGDCEIRFNGASNEPPITVKGDVYVLKALTTDLRKGYMRFSSPPFNMFSTPDRKNQTTLSFESGTRYPLRQWILYEKLTRWSEEGAVDFRISKSGLPFIHGRMRLNVPDHDEIMVLGLAIRKIDEAVHVSGALEPSFKDDDFSKSFDDILRFCLALGPELTVRFPEHEDTPTFKQISYRTKIDFEHLAVHCFVTRPIVSDEVIDKDRVFTACLPKIAEAHIYDNPSDFAEAAVASDYEIFRQRVGACCVVLNLENINALVQVPSEGVN